MKYYIYVKGEKIPVSEEIYKSYWQVVNHQKYVNRKMFANGVRNFSSFDKAEFNFDELLVDERVDVERIVVTKMIIEKLNEALLTLSDLEFSIIKAIYFEDYSIRQVAKEQEMSAASVFRLRNKVLSYLKKIIDK
ncbi:RNA polymerase sigma factor [Streptococcus ruminantium]|uniref:RNA polymerase sigma factor n=1 Tax=Streptococcus ruminantium TaxID=1917441 RepID=UPI0012DD738E|nr:sigma-70 family RNA polymerase sigma factor [Streptococcus ruminantium]